MFIRSCHEDVIFTRKSHNCAGTAFVQGDSVGGSKLTEHTLLILMGNIHSTDNFNTTDYHGWGSGTCKRKILLNLIQMVGIANDISNTTYKSIKSKKNRKLWIKGMNRSELKSFIDTFLLGIHWISMIDICANCLVTVPYCIHMSEVKISYAYLAG